MIRTPFARLGALAAMAAVLVAACGATPPSASPSASPTPAPTSAPTTTPSGAPSASGEPADNDAIYDQIVADVLAIRDLDAVEVARETIDGEALAEMNATNFDNDNPAEYVAAYERLIKAMGLMPEDQVLRDVFLDLLDSQVAGFYRPDTTTLYVVSRGDELSGLDKVTFAHEYTHALQDGHFPDVFDVQATLLEESDQALARAAITEGDASLAMTYWMLPNLTPEDLQDVLAASADPESTAILERTPGILREDLIFPYEVGATFLQPIQTEGGWAAVDAVYEDMPVSTEQVLHPEKYESGEQPIDVSVDDIATDMGSTWTEDLQDTFGEFQTGVWLRESGLDDEAAAAASAGWGGDRMTLVSGQDGGWAVVWRTTWDTNNDAREFQAAAGQAVADGPNPGTVVIDGDDVTVIYASDGPTVDAAVTAADFVFGV